MKGKVLNETGLDQIVVMVVFLSGLILNRLVLE